MVTHIDSYYRGKGTTLRENCSTRFLHRFLRLCHNKGEWNSINVVHYAEAIWPHKQHAILSCDTCQFLLRIMTIFAALSKPGGEDDDAADALLCTGPSRC